MHSCMLKPACLLRSTSSTEATENSIFTKVSELVLLLLRGQQDAGPGVMIPGMMTTSKLIGGEPIVGVGVERHKVLGADEMRAALVHGRAQEFGLLKSAVVVHV